MIKLASLSVILLISIQCFAIDHSSNSLQKQRFAFTENKGQVVDQYANQRKDVDFKLDAGNGLSIFVGEGQIHYQFYKADSVSMVQKSVDPFITHNLYAHGKASDSVIYNIYRLDVKLAGANIHSVPLKENKLNYYQNYYTAGLDKDVTAYNYQKITYPNIYPGIDWVLSISNGGFKQEFIVHPGASAKNIKFQYNGQTQLRLNDDGSITAATPFGNIQEEAPVSFLESGATVQSRYKIVGNTLTYDVDQYDETLIIDPAINWATYFGAFSADWIQGLSVDTLNGDIYIGGYTYSLSNIATNGAHQTIFGGNVSDGFLAKMNASGQLQWSTYFGGSDVDIIQDLCIHPGSFSLQSTVIITGYTKSHNNIATLNAPQDSLVGYQNAFIAKFTDSGQIIRSTYFGNTYEQPSSLAIDVSGMMYITGSTFDRHGFTTPNAHQVLPSKDTLINEAFLAKFNDTFALQWATYYGEADSGIKKSYTAVNDIHLMDGYIYATGYTGSEDSISTPNSHQPTKVAGVSNLDAFLVKFDTSGVRKWATYYGGTENDFGNTVIADAVGNVYIGGRTLSKQNIATTGADKEKFTDNYFDGFLVKFDSTGKRIWGTYCGGSDSDYISHITFDKHKHIFVVGSTSSDTGFIGANALQSIYGGGYWDGFIVEYDTSGKKIWNTYFGGEAAEDASSIGVVDNDLFIAGETASTTGISALGAHQINHKGGYYDGFIASICLKYPNLPVTIGINEICLNTSDILHNNYKTGTWYSMYNKVSVDDFGTIKALSAGVDTIMYIATNACGSDTAFHEIVVHPLPAFTAQPINFATTTGYNAQFTITSNTPGVTYQWQTDNGTGFNNIVDGGQYSGTTTNTLTITNTTIQNNNEKFRCLVSANGCVQQSDPAELLVWPLSVTDVSNTHLSIAPNPVKSKLTISAAETIKQVVISNVLGQVVYSTIADTKHIEVDVAKLPPGMYMLKINSTHTSKFIKE